MILGTSEACQQNLSDSSEPILVPNLLSLLPHRLPLIVCCYWMLVSIKFYKFIYAREGMPKGITACMHCMLLLAMLLIRSYQCYKIYVIKLFITSHGSSWIQNAINHVIFGNPRKQPKLASFWGIPKTPVF